MNPWCQDTDKNLRNFIQQRAAKRIKEIDREVELAKQPLFVTNKAKQTILAENAYLRSGKNSQSSLNNMNTGSAALPLKQLS